MHTLRKAPDVSPPSAGQRNPVARRWATVVFALITFTILRSAAPIPEAAPILAAPLSDVSPMSPASTNQDNMGWVVEQIELRTSWVGAEGESSTDYIPDRSVFVFGETVSNGPREIQGSIEVNFEHPHWVDSEGAFEMSVDSKGNLSSTGSFGAATPSANLALQFHCGDTWRLGGTCGDAQEYTAFDSKPNAQNRSVSLGASVALPPNTSRAPRGRGGATVWTVSFSTDLTLSSQASFTISGRVRYRFSTIPTAPPTFDIVGRALGRPEYGKFCPLNGAKVELLQAGTVIETTRAREPDARFGFQSVPRTPDLSMRVTLEQVPRDPTKTGAFRVTYENRHPLGEIPFVETLDFDGRVATDPEIQNIVFDDLFPLKPDPPGRVLPIGSERTDVGVIYCHTWEAWKLSEIVSQDLDIDLPVDVVAFMDHDIVRWRGPATFLPALTDSWIEIGRGKGASEVDDGGRPDNREWHEFGHQVMADALSNLMPHDNRPCPSGRPAGFNCSHLGYENARSVDSWTEGFAEFYSMMVSDKVLHEERPELYRISGNEMNLEANYLAFEFRGLEGDPSYLRSAEEYAVAGLLLDLVDPPNMLDRTAYKNYLDEERFEVNHYADCVQMDLHPHLWEIINGDWDELHPKSPDAPADYDHIFDIKQLYDVLKGEGYGQAKSRGGPLTDLDELFVAHGFFADADDDLAYDLGEEVGRASRPDRVPDGLGRRRPEWPESARLLGSGRDEDTGQMLMIDQYRLAVRFAAPHQGLDHETWIDAGLDGTLPLVGPPAHYNAHFEISAFAEGGYQSQEPLILQNEEYWQLMSEEPADQLLSHEFEMKRGSIVYLPFALRPAVSAQVAAVPNAPDSFDPPSSGFALDDIGYQTSMLAWAAQSTERKDQEPPEGVKACHPTTPTPITPEPEPTPTLTIPIRVDPDHVYEGLDARLTVAGHFFDIGSTARVGGTQLEPLENLGLDNEPPHYHRLRGNLPAGLAPGSYDVYVTSGNGSEGVLPGGFTILEVGDPTPEPDPPVRIPRVTASEAGQPEPRSAFMASDPVIFHSRIAHDLPDEAPAVLIVELYGPEGDSERIYFDRRDITLPRGGQIGFSTQAFLLPRDLETGEYTLSATVKAYGKQVEAKSQIYIVDALVMRDDFSQPGSGWPEQQDAEVEAGYLDDEYRVDYDAVQRVDAFWREPWQRVPDVVVEADTVIRGNRRGEAGLALDTNAAGDRGLWMRVSNEGEIKLTRRLGDLSANPIDWRFSDAITPRTAPNHLMAVRRGTTWRVYANGTRLRTLNLKEEEVAPGWAGIVAGAFGDPMEMRFDNFRVYEIR